MHTRQSTSAFTIVELLVVVTIIVVLLSLLMPAMDKAVYQGELTVCGANMQASARGAMSYAMDNARLYPARDVIDLGRTNSGIESQPIALAWDGYDDRPRLQPYIPMDMLVEAAAPKVSLRIGEAENRILAGYSLYFGVRFDGNTKGMRKVGDRFTFTDSLTNREHTYSLLAADMDIVSDTDRHLSGHPDSERVLPAWRVFNDPTFGTFSRYDNYYEPVARRGTLDLNYANTDGSVQRLNAVKIDDERIATVSYRVVPSSSGYPSVRVQLPKE